MSVTNFCGSGYTTYLDYVLPEEKIKNYIYSHLPSYTRKVGREWNITTRNNKEKSFWQTVCVHRKEKITVYIDITVNWEETTMIRYYPSSSDIPLVHKYHAVGFHAEEGVEGFPHYNWLLSNGDVLHLGLGITLEDSYSGYCSGCECLQNFVFSPEEDSYYRKLPWQQIDKEIVQEDREHGERIVIKEGKEVLLSYINHGDMYYPSWQLQSGTLAPIEQ